MQIEPPSLTLGSGAVVNFQGLSRDVYVVLNISPTPLHYPLVLTDLRGSNLLTLGPEMVKIKVGISFKRLQFIFFHS